MGSIDDYKSFITRAVAPRDPRINQHVTEELAEGRQWPEPWLSLNRMFAGGSIEQLVIEDFLHPECSKIFRPKLHLNDPGTTPIALHHHQREAIETARTGVPYLPPFGDVADRGMS
jgi:hypothetical protein